MKKHHETEEQRRVRGALEALKQIRLELDAYERLHEAASGEVASFAGTGNLEDLQAVAEILPRQAQATFSEQRIAITREKLTAGEQSLAEETRALGKSMAQQISRIRCGLVEKAARSMREHFDNLQQARRQAFSSTAVRDHDRRAYGLSIENLSRNFELPAIAEKLLEAAPNLFGEAESLDSELGGIPSETELRAP